MPALAAVQAYRDRLVARRGLPVPCATSEAAIAETVQALDELREMEAPEARRPPRSEGAGSDASRGLIRPTPASDRAHLTWQLQRAMLFAMRRAVRFRIVAETASLRSEEALCNLLCGMALVQTAVDNGTAADGGAGGLSQELEVLSGIEGGAAAGTAVATTQARWLRRVVKVARGAVPVAEPAVVESTRVSSGQLDASATAQPFSFRRLAADAAACAAMAQRLAIDASALQSFIGNLPSSLTTMQTPDTPVKMKRMDRCKRTAGAVFGSSLPAHLREVSAVCTAVELTPGNWVMFVHELDGQPTYVSNGVQPSPHAAFANYCKEQFSDAPSTRRVTLHAMGAGMPGTIKGAPNATPVVHAKWKDRICGPANAIRAAILDSGLISAHLPSTPRSVRAVRFLNIVVAQHIIELRSASL